MAAVTVHFEEDSQSFIVKVWLEETAEEAGHATWRGHITHVPSGARRYFDTLDEMSLFVASYLEKMGGGVQPVQRGRTAPPV